MSTLQELLNQKAALDRQIAELSNSARTEAITKIRTLMEENGLTATDIASAPAGQKKSAGRKSTELGTRAKVAPKYRHPTTGATWTGRGLKPRWLTEEIANGRSVSDFAV